MNQVKGKPYEHYGKFWVVVSYTCWGDRIEYTSLYSDTLEEALAITPGFHFLT